MSTPQWTHDWSQPDENGNLLSYAKVYDDWGQPLLAVVRCNVETGLCVQLVEYNPRCTYKVTRYQAPLRVEFCDE